MIIRRARKKPVEISFVRLDQLNVSEVARWCGGRVAQPGTQFSFCSIVIPTKEGEMRADEHDYIIKGVEGEFYPCKTSIFKKTYDIL